MSMQDGLAALTTLSAVLSTIAAIVAIGVTWKVATMQKMLTQRQLLIPLWEYMARLNNLDPDPAKVRLDHLLDALHTLELVALCCEGGMVDELVIKRTFSDPFMKLYQAIEKYPDIPSLDNRNGPALLLENPAAMSFYETLKEERLARNKLKKV
jgi:hypothetical protein